MKKLLLMLIPLLLLTSCFTYTNITTLKDIGYVSYSSPHMPTMDSIMKEGIALTPLIDSRYSEGFKRPYNNYLTIKLHENFTGNFIDQQSVITVLNDSNLIETYEQIINTYSTTGILNKSKLNKITNALGVHYILFNEIITPYFAVSSNGTTIVRASLWSTEAGDIIWEGNPGVEYLQDFNADVLMSNTVESLISLLKSGENNGDLETKEVPEFDVIGTSAILISIAFVITLMSL
jgi:hypothetical protein